MKNKNYIFFSRTLTANLTRFVRIWQVLVSISVCVTYCIALPAYALEDHQHGRWVNFGVIGGQPQGGVVVSPSVSKSGEDIVFTVGDITGLRQSVTGGRDWVSVSDPTSPAMFPEYTVMAIDEATFSNAIEGDEVILVFVFGSLDGEAECHHVLRVETVISVAKLEVALKHEGTGVRQDQRQCELGDHE